MRSLPISTPYLLSPVGWESGRSTSLLHQLFSSLFFSVLLCLLPCHAHKISNSGLAHLISRYYNFQICNFMTDTLCLPCSVPVFINLTSKKFSLTLCWIQDRVVSKAEYIRSIKSDQKLPLWSYPPQIPSQTISDQFLISVLYERNKSSEWIGEKRKA